MAFWLWLQVAGYRLQVAGDRAILKAYVPRDYRMMDVGKIDKIAEAEQFAAGLVREV